MSRDLLFHLWLGMTFFSTSTKMQPKNVSHNGHVGAFCFYRFLLLVAAWAQGSESCGSQARSPAMTGNAVSIAAVYQCWWQRDDDRRSPRLSSLSSPSFSRSSCSNFFTSRSLSSKLRQMRSGTGGDDGMETLPPFAPKKLRWLIGDQWIGGTICRKAPGHISTMGQISIYSFL